MNNNDITKVLDILDKFEFFGGQRAGRELWFGKPVDVQNKDIADFVRDVTFLKDFIADLEAKNKICAEVIARQDNEIINLSKSVDNYESCLKSVEVIRVNAIKEFAEELKGELTTGAGTMRGSVLNIIDSLVKEMTEEHNAEENSI
ncbi:MAG: hypothetical protein IJB52_10450 [Clostridia bacterium]|nr:hypothetical protein [Clostridia bacterium]